MWALMGGLYFFQGKRMNEEEKKHIRDSRSGFGHDKESVVGFHKSRSSGASKKVYPNWKKMDTLVDFFKAN